jgi:hypothetical protein
MHKRGAFFGNQVKAIKSAYYLLQGDTSYKRILIQHIFARSTQLREVNFASGVIFLYGKTEGDMRISQVFPIRILPVLERLCMGVHVRQAIIVFHKPPI